MEGANNRSRTVAFRQQLESCKHRTGPAWSDILLLQKEAQSVNNGQFLHWISDPDRTQPQLIAAWHGLGLDGAMPTTIPGLRAALMTHVNGLPADAPSIWTPPTPAAAAPAAPVAPAAHVAPPVAAPAAPAAHNQPAQNNNGRNLAIALGSVLGLVFLAALLWAFLPRANVPVVSTPGGTGILQPGQPAGAGQGAPESVLPTLVNGILTCPEGYLLANKSANSFTCDKPKGSAGGSSAPGGGSPAPVNPPQGGGTGGGALVKWPTNPAEAATAFCVVVSSNPDNKCDASRWEINPDGGWHLREEAYQVQINPKGKLAEGYFDTKPGKNASCFLFNASAGVQGTTIWNEEGNRKTADNLIKTVAVPKWDDQKDHPCQIMIPQ